MTGDEILKDIYLSLSRSSTRRLSSGRKNRPSNYGNLIESRKLRFHCGCGVYRDEAIKFPSSESITFYEDSLANCLGKHFDVLLNIAVFGNFETNARFADYNMFILEQYTCYHRKHVLISTIYLDN